MTAPTHTPVWDMPKPGMLPTGMPFPQEPEDAVGFTVVHRDILTGKAAVRVGKSGGLTLILDEAAGDEDDQR